MNAESGGKRSRRFKDRYLQHLFQDAQRFEGNLHLHCRHACSAIDRVKGDGHAYFEEGSTKLTRWQKYCQDLNDFILRDLGRRKHKGEGLDTVLREFFQEFEHSSYGLDEMVHQVALDRGDEGIVTDLWDWLALALRNSVYAIVAYWTPDKKQVDICHMEINLTTKTTTQKWTREEMVVPKEYKRATKRP